MSEGGRDTILEVQDLCNTYSHAGSGIFSRERKVDVLDHVTFQIQKGEIFGLVGESGCGKSTLARAVTGLIPSTGIIRIDGETVSGEKRSKKLREKVQIVFQDPYGSLNPRMRIGRIMEEPLRIHRIGSREERKEKVKKMMGLVGLEPGMRNRFPRELSGGQRQRVSIGAALMLNPSLLIADEAVSALDVSISAQILNLLQDLHEKLGLSILFISHNLDVVYYLCDRVAVMSHGRLVEMADAGELYENPVHPYTRTLLSSALPSPPESVEPQEVLPESEESGAEAENQGCTYSNVCPRAGEECRSNVPELLETGKGTGHFVRCGVLNSR